MHPRHGTNHCVPAGACVKHAMRISAESISGGRGMGGVGQLRVGGTNGHTRERSPLFNTRLIIADSDS